MIKIFKKNYSDKKNIYFLSVIIATYNRKNKIINLISDLNKQQTNEFFEIVIIDDGSNDNTYDFIIDWLNHNSIISIPITLLHHLNSGQVIARQTATKYATGNVYLILDDDMRLNSNMFIYEHLIYHRKHNKAVVLGHIIPPENELRQAFELFYEKNLYKMYQIFKKRISPMPSQLYTGNVSINSNIFKQVGGFNLSMKDAEDKELGMRLYDKTSAQFYFAEKAISVHYSDTSSFNSFASRAYKYGKIDVFFSKEYTTHFETMPAYLLHLGGIIRQLLVFILINFPFLRNYLEKVSTYYAKKNIVYQNKVYQKIAILLCSIIYLINYIKGAIDEFGSVITLKKHKKQFWQNWKQAGKTEISFFYDLKLDLIYLITSLNKKVTLKTIIWMIFAMDAWSILFWYRLRKLSKKYKIPFIHKFIKTWLYIRYGIEIAINTEIGHGVHFIHSFGIIVGENVKIGSKVQFFGTNTIGTINNNGQPIIGNNVIIGTGAKILGPIIIRDNAKIGANAVLLTDVDYNQTAVGVPAKIINIKEIKND